VYFSRKSLRQALLWVTSDYRESLRYLSVSKFISLGGILEYYNFVSEEINSILDDLDLPVSYNFVFEKLQSNELLKNLYKTYKATIVSRSRNQFELLCDYLKQIEFNGDCGIVDIGWHGNMQGYLYEVLRLSGLDTRITGYYVGINAQSSVGRVHGYLFDNNDTYLRKDVLCFLGGYEKLFQSLEGSLCSYCKSGKLIEPILGRYEYEQDDLHTSCIKEWQSGAIDFIEAIKEQLVAEEIAYRQWAILLVNFGKWPTLKGVKLFSFFYNTNGNKDYFISQKSIFKYTPKEFAEALSNSTWKTGFLRSAFKLPLPYFMVYKVFRK
jgi:hypothetical protein